MYLYLPLSALLPCCSRFQQQLPVLHLHLCCLPPCLQCACSSMQLQPACHYLEGSASSCSGLLLLLHRLRPGYQGPAERPLLLEAQRLGHRLPLGNTPGGLCLPELQDMPAHHLLPVLVSPAGTSYTQHRTKSR